MLIVFTRMSIKEKNRDFELFFLFAALLFYQFSSWLRIKGGRMITGNKIDTHSITVYFKICCFGNPPVADLSWQYPLPAKDSLPWWHYTCGRSHASMCYLAFVHQCTSYLNHWISFQNWHHWCPNRESTFRASTVFLSECRTIQTVTPAKLGER